MIRDLANANRRTFRAWQLKEELRDIFALPLLAARRALDDWLAYASRSKLAPFVKLARTIRHYRPSIEATIEWRLTNGIAESNNASIGRIRANARGFHDPNAFITMIMLDRAGLAPDLPWAVMTHESVSCPKIRGFAFCCSVWLLGFLLLRGAGGERRGRAV